MPTRRPAPDFVDLHALAGEFERAVFSRGMALHTSGAVLGIDWAEDEGVLRAVVQGSMAEPYELEIDVALPDRFEPWCSCPYEHCCKHAAAALLVFADHLAGRDVGDTVIVGASGAASGGGGSVVSGTRRERALAEAGARGRQWLERYVAARADDEPDDARPPRQGAPDRTGGERWLYRLERVRGTPRLTVLRARPLKRGGFGAGRPYRTFQDRLHGDPVRTTREDAEALSLVASLAYAEHGPYRYHDGSHALTGRTGALLLDLVVSTGRTFLGDDRSAPLAPGPARALGLEWRDGADPDGLASRRLEMAIEGIGNGWIVPTEPPRHVDPDARAVGPLETGLDGEALALVAAMPPVPAETAREFALELAATLAEPGIPLPADVEIRTVEEEPEPVLLLHSPSGRAHVDHWTLTALVAYGPYAFGLDPDGSDARETRVHLLGPSEPGFEGDPVRVRRRPARERALYADFAERCPGFVPAARLDPAAPWHAADHRPEADSPAAAFEAFREVVLARKSLEAAGWRLSVEEPVNVRRTSVSSLDAELEPSGAGWFELGVGFVHEGRRYDLLELVVEWLERNAPDEPLLARAEDGEWLEVPAALLRPVARTLAELGDPSSGEIRLSRARALSLEALSRELDGAGVRTTWRGATELFGLAERLESLASIAADGAAGGVPLASAPRALRAELRPYQLAGLAWLETLAKAGLNGVLADDMGLGKTLQTLAHVLARRRARALDGPVLVVAPTSLLGNWAREAARFAPVLKVRVWHGAGRRAEPLGSDPADLVITSYALSLRDHDALAAHGFAMLVLDEAQTIKNPASKIGRALRALPVERRLCLTGTPLENHLGELWSLFDFLMPGLLGDQARFARHFRTPIEKRGDVDRQRRLASAIRPFLLRRRKEDVASELPAKTEIVREVTLDGAQATLYETIRVAMQERVRVLLAERGFDRSRVQVLDALLKLRQACCHPQLLKLPAARRVGASAKTELALDMVDELVAEGRRILLFSQFTEMLSILETGLAGRGIAHVKLTGRTRRRDAVIDAFQRGEVPVFLISLKAGGTGLNLTAADTVIHYDPWWNPAAEDQASDRAHRIGQDKPVFVYRLVASGTIEERIVAMQARKRALSDATIERGGEAGDGSFTADDLLSLFEADAGSRA